MQLASVRAVVTGGVSGLGLAVAQHLVAHGGKVALFDVNDDKGAAAVAELGEANARYFKTDVTDEAGVAANVAAAKDALGGLNVAINCAGILGAGRVLGLLQQDPAAWFGRGASSDDDARIQALIDERTAAKKSRDYARSDAIRDQLAAEGILLEDTPQGVRWKRA